MKRIVNTSILCSVAFFLIGADYMSKTSEAPKPVKHCSGYTIIEAGLGVDCHGDTVRLVKRSGFYELATLSK